MSFSDRPCSRLASELQALKQKLTTVQSRLKASAQGAFTAQPAGYRGLAREGGIVEIGVDAYSGYPGAATGRGDPELKALIWGFHSLGWQA